MAYLFGSQQKGQVGPLSDVDIAVLFGPTKDNYTVTNLLSLSSELESFYPQRRVDLTPLNNAPPILKKEAVLIGETIYSSLTQIKSLLLKKGS